MRIIILNICPICHCKFDEPIWKSLYEMKCPICGFIGTKSKFLLTYIKIREYILCA
jgi:hypothetical protein